MKGIRGISSTSGNGWGSVSVNLDKHVDAAVARFEASTIIRQTWPELPDGVSYPYIQMHRPGQSNQGPFMAFTINAPATPFLIQQYAGRTYKNASCTDSREFIKSILAELLRWNGDWSMIRNNCVRLE